MRRPSRVVVTATLVAAALSTAAVAPSATGAAPPPNPSPAAPSPAAPSPAAPTAVTIGLVPAAFNVTCLGGGTLVQGASTPAASYVVPFDGVVTSFSVRVGNETDKQVRLMFFGSPTGTSYPVRYRSALRTTLSQSVNQFTVHAPVQAGWLLGAKYTSQGCGATGVAGDTLVSTTGDTGSEPALTGTPVGPYRVNISAVVEPDTDRDGFGDVSEDACVESALAQAACPAPETTLTKVPRASSRKRSVTVAFTSTAARSTFLVVVDGKPAKESLAPYRARLKPGKHTISVQAVSPLGVADPTPAVVTFKIKKKRRH